MAFCLHNPATGREETMPHVIPAAAQSKRVTIIGAGPAGVEAARVAAERGHKVTVFEAADQPGGQIRLTAQDPRRREMISVIAWRMAQAEKKGVTFHFNTYADAEAVLATEPDEVIVATGGLPHTAVLAEGNDLVHSAWDILSGDVKPASNVLIFDDAGDHAALQAGDMISATGAAVEIVTPDRTFSPEVMGMNLVPYMRNMQGRNTTFTVTWRVLSVRRDGNQLRAVLGSDYGDFRKERLVDQVIVNHGTRPLDELYFELKPQSRNLGEVDYEALSTGGLQAVERNPNGRFRVFRIGDAVSARNTHAAIYDALRLVKDL
jgi:NADPH-dependent 2,4-dienoyl-CoA reductase/sulfur reductase-like enzyme